MQRAAPSVPIYTILAACLASARSEAWCGPQLILLDRLTDMIATDLSAVYPKFQSETFHHMARYGYDRVALPRKADP